MDEYSRTCVRVPSEQRVEPCGSDAYPFRPMALTEVGVLIVIGSALEIKFSFLPWLCVCERNSYCLVAREDKKILGRIRTRFKGKKEFVLSA